MDNLTITCPVTSKTLQATVHIDQIIALGSRGAPIAMWCSHCERSHLVSADSLLSGLRKQTPRPAGSPDLFGALPPQARGK
jgi:hypothetical protein